jgi:hypothetical protein
MQIQYLIACMVATGIGRALAELLISLGRAVAARATASRSTAPAPAPALVRAALVDTGSPSYTTA